MFAKQAMFNALRQNLNQHQSMLKFFGVSAFASFGLALAQISPAMYASGHLLELAIVAISLLFFALVIGGIGFVGYVLAGILGHWLGSLLGEWIVQQLYAFVPLFLTIWLAIGARWAFDEGMKAFALKKNPFNVPLPTDYLLRKPQFVDPYATQDTPHLLYGMTCCLLFHA